jgi:predicted nucleic-acid-binding protein
MLGLDTNVLVRFLVRDHEAQFERARRLIKRVGPERVLIGQPAGDWGSGAMRRQKDSLIDASRTARCHGARARITAVEEALYLWKDSTADFADCLIGAHHRRLGCRATATFDARAAKLTGFVAA